MSANSYEHLIVRRPVNVTELPDHELGEVIPFPVYMDKHIVPEAKGWACCMYVKDISQEMVDMIDIVGKATAHKHEFDEIYLMIGDENAITFEIMLGDELHRVSTPGAVYIPRGLAHSIRPVDATVGLTGGLIPVCFNGEYTTVPVNSVVE